MVATNFLLIADSHQNGIFAPDCAKLAELHSWAVDFPKNGEPVPFGDIPQPSIHVKPNWFAPEIANISHADYYESQTALGKMFGDIELPPLNAASHDSRAQQQQAEDLSPEYILANRLLTSNAPNDPISTKLRSRLSPLVDLVDTTELDNAFSHLFSHYAAELERICYNHTLSRWAKSRLTEEEVVMGTIIAKSAQPRMRTDSMSAMREETNVLVRRMWKEIEGGDEVVIKDWANRAWTAWRVSLTKKDLFGGKSFGWIALRAIFEVINELDD
jgi:RNA-dependent RNA polymerase